MPSEARATRHSTREDSDGAPSNFREASFDARVHLSIRWWPRSAALVSTWPLVPAKAGGFMRLHPVLIRRELLRFLPLA
jgi:hypothetical protein